MISFIIKLLILIYLFITIRHIYTMLQYNPNSSVQKIAIPNKDKIQEELKYKNPLLITYPKLDDISMDILNKTMPGYIINDNDALLSLDHLLNSDSFSVYKNKNIINDFQLESQYSKIQELFYSYLTCNMNSYISLYKGEHTTNLLKNYNETTLLQPKQGSITVYLFNPKHESDIRGMDVTTIKKWGIKQQLDVDSILYIPPEWYYFYECKKEVILFHVESDTYLSVIYNYLRKK